MVPVSNVDHLAVLSGNEGGIRQMVLMFFGKQQARGVHIAAGDMGMNIDRARHDDLAGDVMHFVRQPARRRRDDAVVFDP